MEKCKNTECDNKTVGKNVYCSLKCRNIFVNKNLRDYNKMSLSLSGEKDYYLNPKVCLKCNSVLKYEQRTNLYCGHSCATTESNKKRVVSDETKLKLSIIKIKQIKTDELKQVKCKGCDKILIVSKTRKRFCSNECKKVFKRKNMTEFQNYKQDCLFKFNLLDYEKEFDFGLIKEHGWYSPSNKKNNLNGVSRDHMYSIRDGFDNKIEQSLIAHPANCKLILQRENSTKHKKSSITINELKKIIKNWNKKY